MKPWHQVIGEQVFGPKWYQPEPDTQAAYRRGWVEGFFGMWPLGIVLVVVLIFFFWSMSL